MRGDSRHQKETADITRGQQTSKGDSRHQKETADKPNAEGRQTSNKNKK